MSELYVVGGAMESVVVVTAAAWPGGLRRRVHRKKFTHRASTFMPGALEQAGKLLVGESLRLTSCRGTQHCWWGRPLPPPTLAAWAGGGAAGSACQTQSCKALHLLLSPRAAADGERSRRSKLNTKKLGGRFSEDLSSPSGCGGGGGNEKVNN